jgi:hypothetical protein
VVSLFEPAQEVIMGKALDVIVLAGAAAGLFAVVGALFGALAGVLARPRGGAPGGTPGKVVAHSLGRRDDPDSSPLVTGALAGAVDGALFLAVLGFLVGAVLGVSDPGGRFEVLRPPLIAVLALAIGALLLGGLAYLLTWGGARAVGLAFSALMGAAVGWLLEMRLDVPRGLLGGVLVGTLLGILAAASANPRVPDGEDDGAEDQETRPPSSGPEG